MSEFDVIRMATPQSSGEQRRLEAESLIKNMMAFSFTVTEIAVLVGCSYSAISHIIEEDSCRAVGCKLLRKIQVAHDQHAQERLKRFIPHIRLKLLDTCHPGGRPVSEQDRKAIEAALPGTLLRAMIKGGIPFPAPTDIPAVLVQLGDEAHHVHLLFAWPKRTGDKREKIESLKLRLHELAHIEDRLKKELNDLEKEDHENRRTSDRGGLA